MQALNLAWSWDMRRPLKPVDLSGEWLKVGAIKLLLSVCHDYVLRSVSYSSDLPCDSVVYLMPESSVACAG